MAGPQPPNPFTAQLEAMPPGTHLAAVAVISSAQAWWDLLDAVPGREASLAKTKLEEAVFWSLRAIRG